MNIYKYKFLKFCILTKRFFTHKKYFFYRHCIVAGAVIAYYDYYVRKPYGLFSLFDNWIDIIFFPIACLILGAFFNAITFALADAFCKDKKMDEFFDKH